MNATTRNPPEKWDFIGHGSEHTGSGGERYQNDCGLWLVIEGTTVVTWVGNFHIPVRGTKETIGEFESKEAALDAAHDWMAEHPDPWTDLEDVRD